MDFRKERGARWNFVEIGPGGLVSISGVGLVWTPAGSGR